MKRKVGERSMERICRREEHGKDKQERGVCKGYLGQRNMERICRREEHVKDMQERGAWKGYVGQRSMEMMVPVQTSDATNVGQYKRRTGTNVGQVHL